MDLAATMPSLARGPACWPNAPKSSSALGSAWHVRPSEPKVRSCRGSGSPAHTTATGVQANDRSRLDLVVYGATANTGELCCDATMVSPLTRTGHPHPCTVEVHGAALKVAERRKQCTYPELVRGGPQKLLVLGSEIGGRWGTVAQCLVRDLVRLRGFRAPPAVRAGASSPWARRMVGRPLPFCRGPARRCEHGLGLAWPAAPRPGPRRFCTGPGGPPRRRRRAQPLAPAALTRDREPS